MISPDPQWSEHVAQFLNGTSRNFEFVGMHLVPDRFVPAFHVYVSQDVPEEELYSVIKEQVAKSGYVVLKIDIDGCIPPTNADTMLTVMHQTAFARASSCHVVPVRLKAMIFHLRACSKNAIDVVCTMIAKCKSMQNPWDEQSYIGTPRGYALKESMIAALRIRYS